MNYNIKKIIKEYIFILIGLSLYAFAWTAFLLPNRITGGGMSGLSSMIYYATGIPMSIVYFIINVILVAIGTRILGKGFGFKTLFCIVVTSVFFEIFPYIPWISNISEKLLNAIIGGTISGIGLSMVLIQGGSTGGTDILVLIIVKFRNCSPGRLFLLFDLVIITSYMLLPDKTFGDIVYGYVEMVSFTYILDLMMTGNKQSLQVMIFSTKYQEIADRIISTLDRGATLLESVGWYTKTDSYTVFVIVKKNQLSTLSAIVKEIDSKAFMSITPAMTVFGEGFEEIRR